MDGVLIAMAVIACILFLLLDIYLMIIYSHKEDEWLHPVNILCRVLIVISLLQVQMQPMFLIVDSINSRTSTTNLTLFWIILFCSILVNLAFFKPFLTSLYQSDEQDPCWKTALWTIFELLVSMGVFGCFIGLGWLFWGKVYLSITQIKVPVSQSNLSLNEQLESLVQPSYGTLEFQTSIPVFIISFFCLIGYPILVFCGACGLTVLPTSLIMDFINRPKYRRTSEARKIVEQLKKENIKLIKSCESLQRDIQRSEHVNGWFQKRKKNALLEEQLKKLQHEAETFQDFNELFHLELKMENVSPIVWFGKLILGLFCIIFSIMLWVQILLSQLVYPSGKHYGSSFLDTMLLVLEDYNANFLSVGFLMLFAMFCTYSMVKGAFFVSISIPFITIHPIKQNKTWINSFLFQLSLCVLGSCSLIHLIAGTFPHYLRGGDISLIMDDVMSGMLFVGVFIGNKVFIYAYLIVAVAGGVLVLVKMVCCSNSKGEVQLGIQEKRKKLLGKQHKDQALEMVEMTEMSLRPKDNKEKSKTPKKEKSEKTPKKKNDRDVTPRKHGKAKGKKKVKLVAI